MSDYHHNHYVPVWYQKRFVLVGKPNELHRLDFEPDSFADSTGARRTRPAQRRKSLDDCFAQTDLYTTAIGLAESTDIEQYFFGRIDTTGRDAVEHFSEFSHTVDCGPFLNGLLRYVSVQKLRTPKGLAWLAQQAKSPSKNDVLRELQRVQQILCVIWAESIWQIADASQSTTKFLVSDHPVTVYNRRCGPRSNWCRGTDDPDIRFHGTHTLFPLSLEKVLIFTNRSWVQNPYQTPTSLRPHPDYFRSTVIDLTSLQTGRTLSEQEVREINFILKSRARRFVAAANPEWLYPELHVSKADWTGTDIC